MLFFPTADEDFKYFRDHGYDGSINDMHYKAMGDLGYTGSLNDRTHAYLVNTYGNFYEAMRGLRNGTLTFSLSAYIVNGFEPDFVLDYKNSYYRKGGTDSTLSGSVTHARASSATMVDSSGTLVTVGNNVPRVGHHVYNGTAWVNEGVLHESEARTNLLPTSTTLASWSKINVNASLSTVTSLSGNQDAVLVKPTAGTHSFTFLWYTTQYNTGVITSISVFAKASGKDFMTMLDSSGSTNYASFNLSTGAVSNVTSGYTANMEDFGNGWYRCSVVTPTGFNERAIFAVADANNSATSTANGEDGILLYGPQLEAGSTPSSYIPTSGSQVTRAADTLTVPAANLPYSSSNMSIQIDGRMTYSDISSSVEVRIYYWYKDSLNNIYTYLDTRSTRTGQVDFYQENGGVVDLVQGSSTSYSPGILVPFNLSSRHGATFLNGAIDGTALTVNTTPSALPDLSSTNLGVGTGFMGTIGKFRMWDEDLTDAGIEKASE